MLDRSRKGNILLQQRSDDKKRGHHGGAIVEDENSMDAVKREIKEELNLDLKELNLLGVYSGEKYLHNYPNDDHVSCIDIVYICHKYSGEIKFADKELNQTQWFNKNNLPINLSENPKEAIKDYFFKYFKEKINID